MQDMVKGLTHRSRVTHKGVGKSTIIDSDDAMSPGWRQAIIGTNAVIMLIDPVATNNNEMFNEIHTFSFQEMHLKISSAKRRPFCLGLYVSRTAVDGIVVTMHRGMWGQELLIPGLFRCTVRTCPSDNETRQAALGKDYIVTCWFKSYQFNSSRFIVNHKI